MLTRKQALLALALLTSFPVASWAATETTQPVEDNSNVACPYAGPGQGYGPGMMGQGYGSGMMGRGYGPAMMQGRFDSDDFPRGPRLGYMHDPDNLKAQLDSIKDPKVKTKYIEMIKARIAFEESQLDAIKALLDSQK